MFGASALLNGGVGLIGSVITSVVKSFFDLKIKDKELEQKRLQYEIVKGDREHEKELFVLKLQSTKELSVLESIEKEKDRKAHHESAMLSADLDIFKANAKVDKIRLETTYVPENAVFVDKLNAFVRPYIAIVLSTIFSILFCSYVFTALSQIESAESFNNIMDQDFIAYGLSFIENIITYFFGSRCLKRK